MWVCNQLDLPILVALIYDSSWVISHTGHVISIKFRIGFGYWVLLMIHEHRTCGRGILMNGASETKHTIQVMALKYISK